MPDINKRCISDTHITMYVVDNGYVLCSHSHTYVTASADAVEAFLRREFALAFDSALRSLNDNICVSQ